MRAGFRAALKMAPSMLGRCTASATIGLFGIGLYYAVNWLRSLFSASPGLGPDFWTVSVSAVFVMLFMIAITSDDVRDTINTLYPNRPGQRSPYFALAVQPSAAWRMGLRILS